MPNQTISTVGLSKRLTAPALIVTVFVLAMSACVLGLVVWKALEARTVTLARSETDVQNLAHSLAEHASHTLQAADIAMSGLVDLLRYQRPNPERLNLFMRNTAAALPQLRELGVLDAKGDWIYSSLAETPAYNNADRSYFIYHRDTPGQSLRISEPLQSRLTGRLTIILSKRINNLDGSFGGVLVAAIDNDYFHNFYRTFQIGRDGGISLIRTDGIVLVHWPSMDTGKDLSKSDLFRNQLKLSSLGYYKIKSPFDGVSKYIGYEEMSQYPLVVTVAMAEDELLKGWWADLRSDAMVAALLLCAVILLAALLGAQFQTRQRMEMVLREREARYRLLADNIADIVVLLDRDGKFLFVSQSVELVLGLSPSALTGKSCFELVHPDDVDLIKTTSGQLTDRSITRTALFRTYRADRSLAWVEINFKLASATEAHDRIEVVGVLRDVTERKMMEEELTTINKLLGQLATTDGLTDLANRRTLDNFLRQAFATHDLISVMMIDIDNFKGFNDSLGHQAGDNCLKRVATVVADATVNTAGLSARYGGEEFAIVLPNVSEAGALKVADAVRLQIRALGIANRASRRGYLSVSVGIATRHSLTSDEAMLLQEADLALYEAKRRGRNCSVIHSSLRLDSAAVLEKA